jgi:hypothetical protein
MAFTCQNVIDSVSQDLRQQLSSATAGAQQTALIDYTNRTCQVMLRWSNWSFMESIPYYFMTMKGQTDYWIGPSTTYILSAASAPVSGNTTYTGVNIPNNLPAGNLITIAGFTNGGNNGVFPIVSSTSTSIVVVNSGGILESHAGTALITGPAGTVDTQLNLNDVYIIEKDSVRDLSNDRALKWLKEQPIGPTLNFSWGNARLGQPAVYRQDHTNLNILSIYPGPDNQNTSQPVPEPPYATMAAGGTLPARIYFVLLTLVDDLGNEGSPSSNNINFYVPANQLATIKSPELVFGSAANGVKYSHYNVYAVSVTPTAFNNNQSDPTTETLQNLTPIAIGTDWTEPGTGLTTTGAAWPRNNHLTQIGGYVIQFRYFMNRNTIAATTDLIQIPQKYSDIIVKGVNALAWDLLGRQDKVQESLAQFQDGYRQMVVDKNLFPEGVEFVRPDAGSYVNQQILGYLPPFF